jgi:Triose-phosphate Transporter family.
MNPEESAIIVEYEKIKRWEKIERLLSVMAKISYVIFVIMMAVSALYQGFSGIAEKSLFNSIGWAAICFISILLTSLRNIAQQIAFKKSMSILINESKKSEDDIDSLAVLRREHSIMLITAFVALIVADFILAYFISFKITLPLLVLIHNPLFIIMLSCVIFFVFNYIVYHYKHHKLNNEVMGSISSHVKKKRRKK